MSHKHITDWRLYFLCYMSRLFLFQCTTECDIQQDTAKTKISVEVGGKVRINPFRLDVESFSSHFTFEIKCNKTILDMF